MAAVWDFDMAYLEQFTEQERKLLIALPYRVGLWISQSDQTGGEAADLQEKQALESILYGFAEDYCKSEFVEELMKETIAQKEKWPQWQNGLDMTLKEAHQAMQIVRTKLPPNDIQSFRVILQQIGRTIAMAFREIEDDPATAQKIEIFLRYAVEWLKSKLKGQAPRNINEFYNISKTEDEALAQLSKVLGG